MARGGVSMEELLSVLKKTGLPLDDSTAMGQAAMGGRDAIRTAVGGGQVDAMKQQYLQKIQQIAQMDQKLSGVYADPSSPLYIENAARRESAIYGRRSTENKQLGDKAQDISEEQKRLEQETDDALTLYKQLTSETKKEEVRIEKESKAKEKAAKKSTAAADKEQKRLETVLGLKILKDAKINDPAAGDLFLHTPKKFQQLWIRSMQRGGTEPANGFTRDDVQANLESWQKTNKETGATKSVPSASKSSKLQEAIEKLKRK